MNRIDLKENFNTDGLIVLPVIHVVDEVQTERNINIAKNAGCPGVFLINHDFDVEQFLPIIRHSRREFPDYWIGVNFLAVTGKDAFPILAKLQTEKISVDAYWADDARIDERVAADQQVEAEAIKRIRDDCNWNGLYFGGTAFKKQREVDPADYATSAGLATRYMDVVTTSGIATGHSADIEKIRVFRESCDDSPLALASGITPENVETYLPWVDVVLVATGINFSDDFYNIDPDKLSLLLKLTRS